MESVKCIEKTLERIELFGKKNFEKLPNVKYLLSKIKEKDGKFSFQDVNLADFHNVKDQVSGKKNCFAGLIRDCLLQRLQREEESMQLMKDLCHVIDCEGWQNNETDFADDVIFHKFDTFAIPIRNAGVKCSTADALYQWRELVEYAKETIAANGKSYMVTWRKIFASPRSKIWGTF